MKKTIFKLFLSTFIFSTDIFSLDPSRYLTQYFFEIWTKREGLPQLSVTSILQTKDGFLWVGTQNGLARFDGLNFKIYDELKSVTIICLYEGRDGTLYIGTESSGLFFLKDGKFNFITTKEGLSSNHITSIFEDRDGTLWLSIYEGYINKIKDRKITNINIKDLFKRDVKIYKMYKDKKENIWICTSSGLVRFSIEGNKIFNLKSNGARCMLESSEGELLIGTDKGIFKVKNDEINEFSMDEKVQNSIILSVLQDSDKNIWVGTKGSGLFRITKKSIDHFSKLEYDSIFSIFEDLEKNLWIGTYSNGLCVLKDKNFFCYGEEEGLSNNIVFSFAEDKEGKIWIGTERGLNYLSKNEIKIFNKLKDLTIFSILVDRKDSLWLGTMNNGIYVLNNNKIKNYTKKDGLLSSAVHSIYEDEKGQIWIGTREGVNCIKDGKLLNTDISAAIGKKIVFSFLKSKDGIFFIGTNEGFFEFNKNNFIVYNTKKGFPSNIIYSIYEDKDKNLWLGSNGAGIIYLKGGKFRNITIKEGLPDNVIFSILEDDFGNLWFTSNNGIFKINKNEIISFLEGKLSKINFRLFKEDDGLRDSECIGGTQPVSFKTSDGKLLFSTVKGAAVFDPKKIKAQNIKPIVYLENLIVNRKEVKLKENLSLAAGSKDLIFEFTAINFFDPKRTLFKYKLEGYDKDWIEDSFERKAYYTNIPPKKYNFKVIASTIDGIFSEKEANFQFKIKPYFYQTKIFYFTCFLFVALIFYIFYRIRIKIINAKTAILNERLRIAREIHDTLGQYFTGIKYQLQAANLKIKSIFKEKIEQIEKALNLCQMGVEETSETIHILRKKTGEEIDFRDIIKESVNKILDGTNLKYHLNFGKEKIHLNPVVELNLLRIVQESVINSLKHSKAENVYINLELNKKILNLIILDDGEGIRGEKEEKRIGGFGQKGMKERAEEIGGKLEIESIEGKGTKVKFMIDLKKLRKTFYD